MLRLLSGNILLANSKSRSALAAEKRNFYPLDNMRYLKHCTLHSLVVSQIKSVFGCCESKRESTFVQSRFLRHMLFPPIPTSHVGNILGLIESQYLKSCMGRWTHMPCSFHLRSYLTTFFYGWRRWGPERVTHLQKVTQLLSGITAINRNSISVFHFGVAGLNQRILSERPFPLFLHSFLSLYVNEKALRCIFWGIQICRRPQLCSGSYQRTPSI